ncbi:MAG: response regulator [Proteobacteria bacterium]|nr:response regulator [Pseudomonadota bacterium]MBU1739060.1 response regulator [Pseudomonadota bacterium]
MSNVLLVEDDYLIMETTKELLEVCGHQVTAVKNGRDAVKAAEKNENEIDILLLDLTLPDISGLDLLPKLIALKPAMKVIICSGSMAEDESLRSNPAVKGFLSKPFDLQQLNTALGKVLCCG